MARGYLRWSVADLAKRSGVGESTVKRMEGPDGEPDGVTIGKLRKVREALEAAGIEFIPENGGGPGVRLK